jgi:hypothetical protein
MQKQESLTGMQKVYKSTKEFLQVSKSMEERIAIPVPVDLFIRLTQCLKELGDIRNPVVAACDAIDYWMDNASWKPELVHQNDSLASRGYTWKHKDRCLFLPHGTEVRMRHKGEYHYAGVEGDEIKYQGRMMSPGQLANLIAQGSRNAWIHLWVKRPGDTEWRLADHLSPTREA